MLAFPQYKLFIFYKVLLHSYLNVLLSESPDMSSREHFINYIYSGILTAVLKLSLLFLAYRPNMVIHVCDESKNCKYT